MRKDFVGIMTNILQKHIYLLLAGFPKFLVLWWFIFDSDGM